ncbi:TPA: hypothetical protein N0F65_009216 [Lagenidium giganteum]|uniref:ABC transmembrane type-1 domain-containing protein n=1 Tax=Lagenidium giganteum TaxID=4803 RepID=A0AAV2YTM1_9STRA|nr:TPA: hypothetical protein N0F65_009216 [Lagenidium giganteum]
MFASPSASATAPPYPSPPSSASAATSHFHAFDRRSHAGAHVGTGTGSRRSSVTSIIMGGPRKGLDGVPTMEEGMAPTGFFDSRDFLHGALHQESWKALFYYATLHDMMAFCIGAVFAVLAGAALPLTGSILAKMLDAVYYETARAALPTDGSAAGSQAVNDAVVAHEFVVKTNDLKTLSVAFGLVAVNVFIANAMAIALFAKTATNQTIALRRATMSSLMYQEMQWVDDQADPSTISTRVLRESARVYEGVGLRLESWIRHVTQLLLGVVFALTTSWRLTLLLAMFLPFVWMTATALRTAKTQRRDMEADDYTRAAQVVQESVAQMKTVVALNMHMVLQRRYQEALEATSCLNAPRIAFVHGASTLLSMLLLVGGIWYGLYLYANSIEILTIGSMLSVVWCIFASALAILKLDVDIKYLQIAKEAAITLRCLVCRVPELDVREDGVQLKQCIGKVTLQDVSFHFLMGYDTLVCDGTSSRSSDALRDNSTLTSIADGTSGRGRHLSLMLRQKIALARCLLRDPRLWIVDETASCPFDESIPVLKIICTKPSTSSGTQRTAPPEREPRSVLYMPHNVRFAENALVDRVLVFGKGRVLEEGTHDELLHRRQSVYRELHMSEEVKRRRFAAAWTSFASSADAVPLHYNAHANAFAKTAAATSARGGALKSRQNVLESAMPSPVPTIAVVPTQLPQSRQDMNRRVPANEPSSRHHALFHSLTNIMLDAMAGRSQSASRKHVAARLWSLQPRHRCMEVVAMLCSLGKGASYPAMAFVIAHLIERVGHNQALPAADSSRVISEVTSHGLLLLAIAVVSTLLTIGQRYCFEHMGNKLVHYLRKRCFESVLQQELSFFVDPEHSLERVQSLLSEDIKRVKALGREGDCLQLQSQVILVSSVVLAIAWGNWKVGLLNVAFLPLLLFAQHTKYMSTSRTVVVHRSVPERTTLFDATVSDNIAVESVQKIATVAEYGIQYEMITRYSNALHPLQKGLRSRGTHNGLTAGLVDFAVCCGYLVVFIVASSLMQQDESVFVGFFRSVSVLMLGVYGLAESIALQQYSAEAFNVAWRVLDLIDLGSFAGNKEGGSLEQVNGRVEISHVFLSPPMEPERVLLEDFSLLMEPGSVTAIVGAKEASKQGIAALLLRYHDPLSGQVLLDGHNMCKLNAKWCRRRSTAIKADRIAVLSGGHIVEEGWTTEMKHRANGLFNEMLANHSFLAEGTRRGTLDSTGLGGPVMELPSIVSNGSGSECAVLESGVFEMTSEAFLVSESDVDYVIDHEIVRSFRSNKSAISDNTPSDYSGIAL